jgi:hypothetical protein
LIDVGDVHFDGECFAAFRRDFLDEFGEFFFVARGDGNFGAGFRKRMRGVAANALRRAGNDRYFVS